MFGPVTEMRDIDRFLDVLTEMDTHTFSEFSSPEQIET